MDRNNQQKIFKRYAPERDGILEFVSRSNLSEQKLREIDAHTNRGSDEQLFTAASKPAQEFFSSYQYHFRKRSNSLLLRYLNRVDTREICFLGCGWGAEIILLLETGLNRCDNPKLTRRRG